MLEKSSISRILDTYTETTQIPVMYIDDLNSIPTLLSKNYDLSSVLEYAELDEIVDFLRTSFSGTADSPDSAITFYTKGRFVYNIVLINQYEHISAALVSGPLLPYIPDERFIDEIIQNKPLPLHKKTRFEKMVRTLPLVSEDRINHLGRLLYVLSQSEQKSWYLPIREENFSHKQYITSTLYEQTDISTNIKNNEEYNSLYSFCLKLRDKIIQGNMDGIVDLLNDHANIFWDKKSFDDNFRSLKNKCIIICAVACVFAIQGNAPYKRIVGLMVNFSSSLKNMSSAQEIILKTAYTIETFAYIVSISSSNNLSLHIKRVMQYLKSHYREKITLKKLAEYVGLNSVYLSSLIKRETNLSLLDNIHLIRIEEGKNLLIFTNKSIQEISYILGYNYQNHFNHVFKKFTKMTPLEFRQNYGRNSFRI